MDKNELKVQALLERISNITAGHENQAADYRVEITLLSNKISELEEENAQLKASADVPEENEPDKKSK